MTGTPADFWSRRRAAVAAQETRDLRTREAEAQAAEAARLEDRPDEEVLAELDLPAPEEMDHADQVQALLRSTVPQRLRTRALRRLWRLNPVLANVDGLVDYGGDFTDAATVVENIQTLFQVGKGMFDKQAEAQAAAERATRAAEARQAAQVQPRDDEAQQEDPALDDTAPEVMPPAAGRDPAPAPEPGPPADTPDPAPVTARRMRFSFDAAT